MRDGKFISCSNVQDTNKDKIVAEMVGRPVGQYYPKETVEIGGTVLDVENVSQGKAVKKASLEIRKGEIVGLAGLAGAGRTELALAICGLLPMSGGEVFLEGRKVNIRSYKNAMAHGIVYVSEDRGKYGLVLRMSIEQNVTLPQIKQLSRAMFVDRNRESSISDNVIDKLTSFQTIVNLPWITFPVEISRRWPLPKRWRFLRGHDT
jgi:ribose transport system ATP-binding protein